MPPQRGAFVPGSRQHDFWCPADPTGRPLDVHIGSPITEGTCRADGSQYTQKGMRSIRMKLCGRDTWDQRHAHMWTGLVSERLEDHITKGSEGLERKDMHASPRAHMCCGVWKVSIDLTLRRYRSAQEQEASATWHMMSQLSGLRCYHARGCKRPTLCHISAPALPSCKPEKLNAGRVPAEWFVPGAM